MASSRRRATVPLLSNSSRAEYAPGMAPGRTGYLLFARDGACSFSLRAAGAPGRRSRSRRPGHLAARPDRQRALLGFEHGSYLPRGGRAGPAPRLDDRAGKEIGSLESPGEFDNVRLSPDDRQAACPESIRVPGSDQILVGDLARQVLTRLDLGPNDNSFPLWSPGRRPPRFQRAGRTATRRSSTRFPCGARALQSRSSAGPGGPAGAEDWSPTAVSSSRVPPGPGMGHLGHRTRRRAEVPSSRRGRPGLAEAAQFSPDGHWIAFCLRESGRSEVYLTSFPEPGERIRVSAKAGLVPRWRRDGRELYYVSADNS